VRDKVFVGGLEYNLSESDFRRHFEQFGELTESQIIKDPSNGQSRGFGFVRFKDSGVAVHLITKVQVTTLKNRRVDLRSADLRVPDRIASINR
jgi:RNA recognition motif-containing protein